MIHASNTKPKVIPIYADLDEVEIDRVQEITAGTTLNRSKIEEVGRDDIVGWKKSIPTISVALRQIECGNIEFWRKLANKGDSVSTIDLTDFKTTASDILAYLTDDDDTFLGTAYYPGLRMTGFGVSIGDPDALIERNISLTGENEHMLVYGNKYLIYKRYVIASSGSNKTVTISDPVPVADPDASGQYLFRVTKTTAGVTTELTHGTDWSYNGAGTLTINGSSTAGDTIRVWYSAASYIAGQSMFVENDVDLAGISADSVSIYLGSSNYLYRLQSVGIDVTLDRFDKKEVGNDEVVSRGTNNITTKITLGRILEAYTIEEVLRGKAGLSYGKLNVRNFSDNLSLIVKIYSDSTKTTFKLAYKFLDLAPVGLDATIPVSDYITRGVSLEGETGFITTVQGIL